MEKSQLRDRAESIINQFIPKYNERKPKLYDTMRRRVLELSTLHPGEFRMYTCGPTVYDYPHIGNLRTFTQEDILRRWLKFKGLKVIQVMNLTDVDDKTIKRSRELKMSLREYTDIYTKAFFQSIDAINLERAEYYPRATEFIPQMVEMIKKLLQKGLAYRSSDGSIYYAVSKFPSYGKLSGIDLSKIKPGARISHDEYDKDSPADFALWKAWTPEDGDVFWETEIGKGRPGWHIECSVMSTHILGPTLDLHGGGVDLIFPHHENEIAQSEGANDVEFCRHWFHVEHLMVEGQKMSKSLGNIYTVNDIVKRNFNPLALRLFYLTSHYRAKQNFTWEALKSAQRALERLKLSVNQLKEATTSPNKYPEDRLMEIFSKRLSAFGQAMDDDLNIPKALGEFFSLVDELRDAVSEGLGGELVRLALNVIEILDQRLLGLKLLDETQEVKLDLQGELSPEIENLIQKLVNLRSEARKKKNWNLADRIREDLRNLGITLEDLREGTRWKVEPGTDLSSLSSELKVLVDKYLKETEKNREEG